MIAGTPKAVDFFLSSASAGLPGLRTLHLIAEQLLGLYQKGVMVEKYSQVGLEHIDVSLM